MVARYLCHLPLSLAPPRGTIRRGSLGGCRASRAPCSSSSCTGIGWGATSTWARLLASAWRFLASPAWLFHNVSPCLEVGVSCRGEEDRGKEVKKLLNAWSPRRSPLQASETRVVVSSEESKMTRRSLNHRNWSEGWEVQRVLYARDPQTGDRKVDVVSFFACMQL